MSTECGSSVSDSRPLSPESPPVLEEKRMIGISSDISKKCYGFRGITKDDNPKQGLKVFFYYWVQNITLA